jgi:hypothetical protein
MDGPCSADCIADTQGCSRLHEGSRDNDDGVTDLVTRGGRDGVVDLLLVGAGRGGHHPELGTPHPSGRRPGSATRQVVDAFTATLAWSMSSAL